MDRRELLVAALDGSRHPAEVSEALAGAPWDSEPLVVLCRAHVCGVLKRYLAGEWSAADVEQWADLLEVRDDVGLEPGFEDQIKEALFDLANPDIQGRLDHRAAKRILARLEELGGSGP